MVNYWDSLESYRGVLFEGEWPSIYDMFCITVQKHPHNCAFSLFEGDHKHTISYAEAHDIVRSIGHHLRTSHITKGDKVVLVGKNSPSWALSYIGILSIGAVVVPLDCQLSVERICALGTFSEASAVIIDSDILQKIETDTWVTHLKTIVVLDSLPFKDYQTINSMEKVVSTEFEKPRGTDIAAILFTSGTTGNEKGVVLTHANFTSDVYQAGDARFLAIQSTDVFYALLPLHHSYAMTAVFLESIEHGCELLFGQGMVISRILSDMRKGKVSLFLAIPLLYNKLLSGLMKKIREKGIIIYAFVRILMTINGILRKLFHCNPGRRWFATILDGIGMKHNSLCICGGGPLSPKTFLQFQQLGLDFIQGYGLTETAPIITLNPVSKFKIHSVGKVFPLVTMRIADPDLLGVGEVQVKGPNICQGYYKDTQHTQELFTEDGFLRTGDLGYLDNEQYLYLKGRAKNVIVTEGGKNVYPEEIEDFFQLYGQVEQIMIRGYLARKSEKVEGIEALIYPNAEYYAQLSYTQEQREQDIHAIVQEVNKRLISYKKVDKITILAKPMEMTTTKKIQRGKVSRTIDRLLGTT